MEKRNEIQTDLLCGHPHTRLLYVTPELCLTDSFRKTLTRIHQQGQLERIAIDEAHCISEWGHDFRTAYKELSWFKRCLILPSVPIMALTATATPRVQSDIISSLGLDASSLKLYAMSTARPNIHYEIRYTNDSKDPFPSFVKYLHECHARRAERLALPNPPFESDSNPPFTLPLQISGIIYVRLRTTTESLASKLRANGIGATPFHAGLPASVRDATQMSWLRNEPSFAVIVATTAFGMGIDKDDVRFVVHWDLPKSFEGFYQEAGRAGRDGNAALSIVYYSREERDRTLYRLANDSCGPKNGNANPTAANIAQSKKEQRLASFNALVAYCESTTQCRHELIKTYFAGETSPATAATAPMPVAENTQGAEPECDYACDFCKSDFERPGVKLAKERGLASEQEAFAASQWGNQAEIEAGRWDD
jgi:RecQ family ATP-dependent DNA helicase